MKILVVDDSKAMRALIRRILGGVRYAAARIDEADNGREALDAIRSSPPDLVLANFNMPEIVTSDDSEANIERAHRAGARFVIGKPFTRESLRRALNEATERKRNQP